jgi:hypothetical protein
MSTDADAGDNNSSTNNATNKLVNNACINNTTNKLINKHVDVWWNVDIVSDWNNDAQDQASNRNDVSMVPAQASSSNYGKINVQPASNDYDESFLKHSPATKTTTMPAC